MKSELYDHPAMSQSYFFPLPSPTLPSGDGYGSIWLDVAGAERVQAFSWHQKAGRPTVLYFHGNGECVADQLHHWPKWAEQLDVNLMLVDYPGYGASGGEPSLSSCRSAARAAVAYLLERGEDEVPNIVVMGRSVGSIFAIDVAAQIADSGRLQGLILESGIADLWQRFEIRLDFDRLGLDASAIRNAIERDFNHESKVCALSLPILVLHCRQDSLVPIWHGEHLASFSQHPNSRLHLFERGDHNSVLLVNADQYLAEIESYLELTASQIGPPTSR